MSQASLEDLLTAGRGLRDLAHALGESCLDSLNDLGRLEAQPQLVTLRKSLQAAVEQVELEWWSNPQRQQDGYLDLLNRSELAELAGELAPIAPPLAVLAVLRAVCARPLTDFYTRTWGSFELRRGDPFPLPLRPNHRAFDRVTPGPATMQRLSLLRGTKFRIYNGPANTPITVTLDFADRENLDEATWIGDRSDGRMPAIASIHPYRDADELTVEEVTDETFFWVTPNDWRPGEVLGQLGLAADAARIAVMPELSLPDPEALGSAIAEAHHSLPDLIVTGSAHAEVEDPPLPEGVARVNRLVVYLHGARLLHHDKIHPFVARYLGPEHNDRPRTEDLTPRPYRITIAAGTLTRLAAVICADLNDHEIPSLLEEVGVNLLLVPALTNEAGAFSSACGTLARCQGVTVIVNGTPVQPPGSVISPFMVLIGLPIPTDQVREISEPGGVRRAIGLIRLGKPPLDFQWL
jgi:hypothetical protein